jgi:hypothetical protein
VAFAQEKKEDHKKEWHYKPNFMVGFDLLNTGASFFSDRKLYQGFISSRIKDKVHGVIDAGFDSNVSKKWVRC